eukprot:scaffold1220_cov259-Pinguiococcus_pyrenoidosus.AAC.62
MVQLIGAEVQRGELPSMARHRSKDPADAHVCEAIAPQHQSIQLWQAVENLAEEQDLLITQRLVRQVERPSISSRSLELETEETTDAISAWTKDKAGRTAR